jgi:hypothetical protein
VLVILNLPIILSALITIIAQFKLKKISARRFRNQIIVWTVILILIIGSFPLYNLLVGKHPLDSSELSLFDILEVTAIIFLFYAIIAQRQRLDQNEKRLRELHQELSIKLSKKD